MFGCVCVYVISFFLGARCSYVVFFCFVFCLFFTLLVTNSCLPDCRVPSTSVGTMCGCGLCMYVYVRVGDCLTVCMCVISFSFFFARSRRARCLYLPDVFLSLLLLFLPPSLR